MYIYIDEILDSDEMGWMTINHKPFDINPMCSPILDD